ncbi:MAG TPA: histidinol dehydrogenase, partial [Solirubrobacterales bacterium]|nr:histidinol dehydrogenase [Solirubrobacterales bacterium]
MKVRRFEWEGAVDTAAQMRGWATELSEEIDVGNIWHDVVDRGDDAVIELTNRFDATERARDTLRVDIAQAELALDGIDPAIREAMEIAAVNIRSVAEAQLPSDPAPVELPQGQNVTVRDVAVGAAGIYAPGGRAAYPSSVLMCVIPAQVAGVDRITLASPPNPDGNLNPLVLSAAALCGVEEIYAVGGAQAIFALAYGTETIAPVDVIAGPGNAWVREAKRTVYGQVGIDSLAGPSELMLVAGHDTDPKWAALDLCSQAEHGLD